MTVMAVIIINDINTHYGSFCW